MEFITTFPVTESASSSGTEKGQTGQEDEETTHLGTYANDDDMDETTDSDP